MSTPKVVKTLTPTTDQNVWQKRANTLQLHGLIEHWHTLDPTQLSLVTQLIEWEEAVRGQRGLERRLSSAHLGKFKPLADFDWNWPAACNKDAISELMNLSFIRTATNVVLVGPNGVGKTMVALNLAYRAVTRGHSARFVTAAKMLGDLSAQDGASALERRLRYYCRPEVLVIDELGYLSYNNQHADLLFEVVNRRYESKPNIITTNRPFGEWGEVFPNIPCVVSIIDRLVHHSEILSIDGDSYRVHEAEKRANSKKPAGKRSGS
jgi:DNA replication protein DnaC